MLILLSRLHLKADGQRSRNRSLPINALLELLPISDVYIEDRDHK